MDHRQDHFVRKSSACAASTGKNSYLVQQLNANRLKTSSKKQPPSPLYRDSCKCQCRRRRPKHCDEGGAVSSSQLTAPKEVLRLHVKCASLYEFVADLLSCMRCCWTIWRSIKFQIAAGIANYGSSLALATPYRIDKARLIWHMIIMQYPTFSIFNIIGCLNIITESWLVLIVRNT